MMQSEGRSGLAQRTKSLRNSMLQATVNVGICFVGLPWETLFSNAGNDLHGELRVQFFA
jgi:hypothetical protein